MKIPFSPPYIGDEEIKAITEVLKSGWITTGPKSLEFEEKISLYLNSEKINVISSATAGLETCLRVLGIGKGDEVIIPAYTYTATASAIIHVGAKPIIVDINNNNFNISLDEVEKKITNKTKAIIPVDFGGFPIDYQRLNKILKSKKKLFVTNNKIHENIGKIAIISDSAHSFGAIYKGKKIGSKGFIDFAVYSFHAVKNLTTAEGGAISYNFGKKLNEIIYKEIKLNILHGQTKDAFSKINGNWEYDIIFPGYKSNMTDIQAAIGIIQLKKYDNILKLREDIYYDYNSLLKPLENKGLLILPNWIDKFNNKGSFHLYPILLNTHLKNNRNDIIKKLTKKGIITNVHFKPLPLLTAYKNLGYKINQYPNALDKFEREISLPIWPGMKKEEIKYIVKNLNKVI